MMMDLARDPTARPRWNFGVRLVVMSLTLLGLLIALQLGTRWLLGLIPAEQRSLALPLLELAVAAVMIGIYRREVQLLERRSADELSMERGLPLAGAGLLLGGALFALSFLFIWLAGGAQYRGFGGSGALVVSFTASLVAAVAEEVVFRGAVFRLIDERFGTVVALIVSAAIFGVVHGLNPGATVVSTLSIALEAGVLLGAAYAAARTLWLPIGIHLGWNFFEGGIFGTSVSGNPASGMFNFSSAGPPLLSGGAFGPEASIFAVGVGLLAAALLCWFAWQHGRFRYSGRSSPVR